MSSPHEPEQELPLPVELVPKTTWGVNVRTILNDRAWGELRQNAFGRAQLHCRFCGTRFHRGNKGFAFHAHERWAFDEAEEVQYLVGIDAICSDCHTTVHIGRAHATGQFDIAFDRLQRVNHMSRWDAKRYLDFVFFEWELRSEIAWEVRIDWAMERLKHLRDQSFVQDWADTIRI